MKKKKEYSAAINVASKGIASSDANVCAYALSLFEALVEKKEGYDAAIDAASEGIKSDNEDVRYAALNLLKVLIEKLMTLVEKGDEPEQLLEEASRRIDLIDPYLSDPVNLTDEREILMEIIEGLRKRGVLEKKCEEGV